MTLPLIVPETLSSANAGAGERLVGADVVVDEVVGDVEALRLVEVADDGLRVAGDLEAVDRGELAVLAGRDPRCAGTSRPCPCALLT